MSKINSTETTATAGSYLFTLASFCFAIYGSINHDQPKSLIGIVSFVVGMVFSIGMTLVIASKLRSGESGTGMLVVPRIGGSAPVTSHAFDSERSLTP